MKSRQELKQEAKNALKVDFGMPILLTFLFTTIVGIATFIPNSLSSIVQVIAPAIDSDSGAIIILIISLIALALSIIASLASLPLTFGFVYSFLDFAKRKKCEIGNLFIGFKKYLSSSLLTYLLINIFTALWSLLFIFPGIIKGLSYAMAPYILADNPSMSPTDTIKKSMSLMEGHIGELFVLRLSFIGWSLLALLTCGVGFYILTPYMQTTEAYFYLSLIAENNADSTVPSPEM